MSSTASVPPRSDRPPKVAIPRLERRPGNERPPHVPGPDKISRVPIACVGCRARKTRCDGGQPRCHNCLATNEPCTYQQSRKNRLKIATEHNQDMVDLLRNLGGRVVEQDRRQIENLLARVVDDVSDTAAVLDPPQPFYHDAIQGEANVSAEVGSDEDLDILDEDVLHTEESRATGFVGKSSELQWLRRLQQNIEHPKGASAKAEGPYGPPGDTEEASLRRTEALRTRQHRDSSIRVPTSASTFYLDKDRLDVDHTVNPYELPPLETAQRLLDGYITTVQDSFPILAETSFKYQFDRYYTSVLHGTPFGASHKWLATLNLVFAIGAKYLHLIQADWQVGGQDHQLYYSRAHTLGLNGPSFVDHPDLLQVQTTALLAFYLFSIGHVNRAWVVMGFSLRYAHALGLHVRNEDRNATTPHKEVLLRVWWGLYSLEGILSTIVGRPSFVVEEYCSAPLPLPLATEQLSEETVTRQFQERYGELNIRSTTPQVPSVTAEPSNAGSYLKSRVQIGMITQKVMVELYSPVVVTKSWKHVQQVITHLCEQLEAWATSLPSNFNFAQMNADAGFQRERLILQMHYIGTKILITRPCLCKLDARIVNQTKDSNDFNKRIARISVGTAKAMADLLPDNIDTTYLYKSGPWWSVVHSIMQALIVLLLEMFYGTVHFPEDGQEILMFVKKLIRWLRTMAKNNQIADHAYTTAFGMLQRLAAKLNADISDLIREDTTRASNSTASNSEDRFAAGDHGQHFPFSDGEYDRVFGEQVLYTSNFYDNQPGYASTLETLAAQPQDNPPLPENYSQTHRNPHSMLRNPFVNVYDEENPDTSWEDLFSIDAFR